MKGLLLVCAALLLLGIASLPIGYYTLLRIIVCITAGIVIYNEFQRALTVWIIVFGIMAIVFNPILPVYLNDKGAWIPIDLIAAVICLIKAFYKSPIQSNVTVIPPIPVNTPSRTVKAIDFYNSGTSKFENKDYTGALADFDKSIELNPDAVTYCNRGVVKDEIQDYYGAIADYTKAIELKQNYSDAYYNRGNAKCLLKDFNGAIFDDYAKVIEINPGDADAYHKRGFAKSEINDYPGALTDFDKAIELKPTVAEYNFFRGLTKLKLQHNKEALVDFNKAISIYDKEIELSPQNSQAYFDRGKIKFLFFKDFQGVINDFNKAIELNPISTNAVSNDIINDMHEILNNLQKDNDDLRNQTADQKFQVIVNALNNHAFGGAGTIITDSKREFKLWEDSANQIIHFNYGYDELIIIWRYKYFQKEVVHERHFDNVINLSNIEQQRIAETMISEMHEVKAKHHSNVLGIENVDKKMNIEFEFLMYFHSGIAKAEMQDYKGAIDDFENAIDYKPYIVYTSIATCHYMIAQGMLQAESAFFEEYKKGYSAIKKAMEYESTDDLEIMQCNLLAGILSGGLNVYYSKIDFSETKHYLQIAADLGSIEAKGLLRSLP